MGVLYLIWVGYNLFVCTSSRVNANYDVKMTTMASQITSLTVVYSTVYSGAGQRKYQSSPHKGPVTRKMFPFDDVIMGLFPKTTFAIHSGGQLPSHKPMNHQIIITIWPERKDSPLGRLQMTLAYRHYFKDMFAFMFPYIGAMRHSWIHVPWEDTPLDCPCSAPSSAQYKGL